MRKLSRRIRLISSNLPYAGRLGDLQSKGSTHVTAALGSGGPVTLERAETRSILPCSNMGVGVW